MRHRADEVSQLSRFVQSLGATHQQGHTSQILLQHLARRQIVDRIALVDEEGIDSSLMQLTQQGFHVAVASLHLVRRLVQVHRSPVVPEEVVDEIAKDLHGHVLLAADHQAATLALPKHLRQMV